MPTKVNDLFPRLAKILVDLHAEGPWLQAFIEAEALDPTVRSYSLWYEVPEAEGAREEEIWILDFKGLWDDLNPIFQELWDRWSASTDGQWQKARFSLTRAGEANLDIEYPCRR